MSRRVDFFHQVWNLHQHLYRPEKIPIDFYKDIFCKSYVFTSRSFSLLANTTLSAIKGMRKNTMGLTQES